MSHRAHLEAENRTLKYTRNSSRIMSGVTFVLAGLFRQTLPVIAKGTLADIIKACLKSSPLRHSIQTLNLRMNMGAHLSNVQNNNFPEKALNFGEGKLHSPNVNSFQVV